MVDFNTITNGKPALRSYWKPSMGLFHPSISTSSNFSVYNDVNGKLRLHADGNRILDSNLNIIQNGDSLVGKEWLFYCKNQAALFGYRSHSFFCASRL